MRIYALQFNSNQILVRHEIDDVDVQDPPIVEPSVPDIRTDHDLPERIAGVPELIGLRMQLLLIRNGEGRLDIHLSSYLFATKSISLGMRTDFPSGFLEFTVTTPTSTEYPLTLSSL